MKPILIALFSLCLPLMGADKKTDVEQDGYKGRVKSVKVSAFKIEEKDGKQVRTQVRTFTPSAKYDEKGNKIKQTTSVPKTPNGETRFVPAKEETWKFTYWD